jgi:hypothetical protein
VDSTSPVAEGRPPALPLILFAAGIMVCSALVLGLVTILLGLSGGYDPDSRGLAYVSALPLPCAPIGAVASWRSGRWWPWYVGLVLTFVLPILLAIFLAASLDPGFGNREFD